MVKPIAQPIIDRIGRESMSRTLVAVQRTETRAGPDFITAARATEH
jgi:hypothetical protein